MSIQQVNEASKYIHNSTTHLLTPMCAKLTLFLDLKLFDKLDIHLIRLSRKSKIQT